MSSINKKNNLKKIGYHILLIIIFTVFLIPIIIIIESSNRIEISIGFIYIIINNINVIIGNYII